MTLQAVRTIKLPGSRLRRVARSIAGHATASKAKVPDEHDIKIVCISDTHNNTPGLPLGDVLFHAGDLTEWGSFDEIQAQLTWLSAQPHEHKIIIAGNHDILFDPAFLESERDRFPVKNGRTVADLDFGTVTYLQDSSITLRFAGSDRVLTVYGSPWTPKYVKSAFQYERDTDIWQDKLPHNLDVLLTHGPPFGHLDGFRRSGCPYLAQAIEERRPKLVIFGHIHVGHGRERVVFDKVRCLYEDIERGWSGWGGVGLMLMLSVWTTVSSLFGCVPRSYQGGWFANLWLDPAYCECLSLTNIFVARARNDRQGTCIQAYRSAESAVICLSKVVEDIELPGQDTAVVIPRFLCTTNLIMMPLQHDIEFAHSGLHDEVLGPRST